MRRSIIAVIRQGRTACFCCFSACERTVFQFPSSMLRGCAVLRCAVNAGEKPERRLGVVVRTSRAARPMAEKLAAKKEEKEEGS